MVSGFSCTCRDPNVMRKIKNKGRNFESRPRANYSVLERVRFHKILVSLKMMGGMARAQRNRCRFLYVHDVQGSNM